MYTRGLQIKLKIGQNGGHFLVVICKGKRKTILWPPCIFRLPVCAFWCFRGHFLSWIC